MHTIFGDLDYVQGHLRYGHLELHLDDEAFEEFKSMSEEEQKAYLNDNGNLIVDSYEVDDWGDIIDISY